MCIVTCGECMWSKVPCADCVKSTLLASGGQSLDTETNHKRLLGKRHAPRWHDDSTEFHKELRSIIKEQNAQ